MIRARTMLATLAAATTLAGCTMLDGYGGLSVGYGDGYHDDGYYDDGYYGGGGYYGESGYYGDPYYGWYGDYYYPGLGAYVYDRGGRRHGWSASQRRYWEARRAAIRDRRELRENWSEYRRERREDWREDDHRDRRGDHDGRRGGWRERREAGQAPGQAPGQAAGPDRRGERREGWRGRGADVPSSPPPGRQWRRDAGPAGGDFRRERRGDQSAPAPRAMPRSGADAIRAPRPQMEARPMPQAVRPEPRPERAESPSAAEALAPKQPE